MMDAVVLLTPIFLVGIAALLGFVGGNQIFGLSPTQEALLTTKILASFARVPAGTAQGQVLFHMLPQSPPVRVEDSAGHHHRRTACCN